MRWCVIISWRYSRASVTSVTLPLTAPLLGRDTDEEMEGSRRPFQLNVFSQAIWCVCLWFSCWSLMLLWDYSPAPLKPVIFTTLPLRLTGPKYRITERWNNRRFLTWYALESSQLPFCREWMNYLDFWCVSLEFNTWKDEGKLYSGESGI